MFLKNAASQSVGIQMLTAADGTAFTGTVTVYVTVDRGTQTLGSVGSGVCTHEGNGYHTYAPAQAETNGDYVGFTFIGTGASPATLHVYPTALNDLADALFKRDMSAVTGEAARSMLNALRLLRNKSSVAAGTLTVTKEDDSTSAWTATVTTNATAEPIIGIDPA